jgi:hypothetical protein
MEEVMAEKSKKGAARKPKAAVAATVEEKKPPPPPLQPTKPLTDTEIEDAPEEEKPKEQNQQQQQEEEEEEEDGIECNCPRIIWPCCSTDAEGITTIDCSCTKCPEIKCPTINCSCCGVDEEGNSVIDCTCWRGGISSLRKCFGFICAPCEEDCATNAAAPSPSSVWVVVALLWSAAMAMFIFGWFYSVHYDGIVTYHASFVWSPILFCTALLFMVLSDHYGTAASDIEANTPSVFRDEETTARYIKAQNILACFVITIAFIAIGIAAGNAAYKWFSPPAQPADWTPRPLCAPTPEPTTPEPTEESTILDTLQELIIPSDAPATPAPTPPCPPDPSDVWPIPVTLVPAWALIAFCFLMIFTLFAKHYHAVAVRLEKMHGDRGDTAYAAFGRL